MHKLPELQDRSGQEEGVTPMHRKVLVMLSSLTLLVFSAGAAGAASPAHPAPGGAGELIDAVTAPALVLDPMMSNSLVTREIDAEVFDELVTYNSKFEIMPDLATSWTTSDGAKIWRFRLAHGIKFQNGQTMTSADVVASLDRYMSVGVGGATLGNEVSSVTAEGPYAIQITLKKSDPNLTALLGNPLTFIAIMPAKYAKSRKTLLPPDLIGTGPYEISKWVPDQYTLLTRFAGYTPPNRIPATGFGGDRIAYFQHIKFLVVPDAETRLGGLELGQFQYAEALPYAAYQSVRASTMSKPYVINPYFIVVWYVNEFIPPLNNVWLRRAMVAALNDTAILKFITSGNPRFYQTNSSLFFPQQASWYDPSAGAGIYNRPNPALVKADLKKAGYKGQPIVLLTNHQYFWMYDAALAAAQQWKADGINVKLDVMTWPSQLTYLTKKHGWNLFTSGNSVRFDPSDYSPILQTGGSADFGFSSKRMDALLAQGQASGSIAVRARAYDAAQRLAWKLVPQIQVGDIMALDGASRTLHGYHPWYLPRFWNVW